MLAIVLSTNVIHFQRQPLFSLLYMVLSLSSGQVTKNKRSLNQIYLIGNGPHTCQRFAEYGI